MTKINLLPWREDRREQRTQQFYAVLATVASVVLVIMVGVHFFLASKINGQEISNARLKKEIKILDRKIGEIRDLKKMKTALIARMTIIQALQTNRPQVVHLFDEVIKILPEGVHLTEIERQGAVVTLIGMAESNTNVSTLMRKVEASKWLQAPVLGEIKKQLKKSERAPNKFTLRMTLVNPRVLSLDLFGKT